MSGISEFWETKKICFEEKYGIYEIYSETLKTITYYSFFGGDGWVKVHVNLETGKQTRKLMNWKTCPKHLKSENGMRYNYFCG